MTTDPDDLTPDQDENSETEVVFSFEDSSVSSSSSSSSSSSVSSSANFSSPDEASQPKDPTLSAATNKVHRPQQQASTGLLSEEAGDGA